MYINVYYSNSSAVANKYEPQHDKSKKNDVRPAKTQISLDIRPVWSESSLHGETLDP